MVPRLGLTLSSRFSQAFDTTIYALFLESNYRLYRCVTQECQFWGDESLGTENLSKSNNIHPKDCLYSNRIMLLDNRIFGSEPIALEITRVINEAWNSLLFGLVDQSVEAVNIKSMIQGKNPVEKLDKINVCVRAYLELNTRQICTMGVLFPGKLHRKPEPEYAVIKGFMSFQFGLKSIENILKSENPGNKKVQIFLVQN
jgi:hypothetical protein